MAGTWHNNVEGDLQTVSIEWGPLLCTMCYNYMSCTTDLHFPLSPGGPARPTPDTTSTLAAATTLFSSEPTEIPFYEEAAFIVGMVVLGVILLFILCSIFLCCVSPRSGGDKKGLQVSRSFQLERPSSKKRYSKLSQPSPERSRGPITGSWSPGDPYTVNFSG